MYSVRYHFSNVRNIAKLQDPFKDICMNGKSNYELKHNKSMRATIDAMFVNEKIIRIYLFI